MSFFYGQILNNQKKKQPSAQGVQAPGVPGLLLFYNIASKKSASNSFEYYFVFSFGMSWNSIRR